MNLFQAGPEGPKEDVSILYESPTIRLEKISSYAHTSPPGFYYEQLEDEWVSLLVGEATLSFADGERHILRAGEHLLIPAGRRHRVENTSRPAVWLCLFVKKEA